MKLRRSALSSFAGRIGLRMMLPSISAGPLLCNNLSYLIFILSMLFYQDTIFSTTIQAEGQGNAKNFIAKARKFTDMTELTPELLRTFVAKIIVYEKEVKYSKHAPQKIHICFRDFNLNETDDMLLCGETTEKADSTILPTLRRARSRSLRPSACWT